MAADVRIWLLGQLFESKEKRFLTIVLLSVKMNTFHFGELENTDSIAETAKKRFTKSLLRRVAHIFGELL